jgi:glutathione S-transferase
MLKILGRITSINVRKVVLTAQWLGIPFDRSDAGLHFGVNNTPEYLALNPNGLVPLLDDDGFTLWESNVIVRYLCAKHALGTLYPVALPARFDAERWMDWQQTTLNPAGRPAFIQLFRTPVDQRDAKALEKSLAAVASLMQVLDTRLADRAYVTGSEFTMADVPLACEVHRWQHLPIDRPALPHLERWFQGIRSHAACRGVFDVPLA